MSVTNPESIATNPENGNLCQGFSSRHGELSMSKESGSTCMNPVARIIPEAKALTIAKRSRSGRRAGIDREKSGAQTPKKLVARIAAIAMILRGSALAWLTQLPVSPWQFSGTTEAVGNGRRERKKTLQQSLRSEEEEAMERREWLVRCCCCLDRSK